MLLVLYYSSQLIHVIYSPIFMVAWLAWGNRMKWPWRIWIKCTDNKQTMCAYFWWWSVSARLCFLRLPGCVNHVPGPSSHGEVTHPSAVLPGWDLSVLATHRGHPPAVPAHRGAQTTTDGTACVHTTLLPSHGGTITGAGTVQKQTLHLSGW